MNRSLHQRIDCVGILWGLSYFFVLSILCCLCQTSGAYAQEANWAIVTNIYDRTIHTIDLSGFSPVIHGPFFVPQMGFEQVHDVAIAPDYQSCLISNFDEKRIHRVTLTNPMIPTLSGSLSVSFNPLDIAVAPNGSYAIVGGDMSNNKFAIIDLAGFTLTTEYTLKTTNGHADAVAIAADNQTVVFCDHTQNRIIYGIIDPVKGFTSESTLSAGIWPANVAISPDGKTVLVADYKDYGPHTISIFEITSPGVLVPGTPPQIDGFPGRQDSIVFSSDGTKAYIVSDQPDPDELSWVQINGPGQVAVGGMGVSQLLSSCYNYSLGVDIIDITADGAYAVIGNSMTDGLNGEPYDGVSLVDLTSFAVTALHTDVKYPQSVASFLHNGSPWILLTNTFDSSITTINMGSGSPTIYGPFFGSPLGAQQIFDVVVSNDGRFAYVSNHQDHKIHKLDLLSPSHPTYVGAVDIGFSARDIALYPNGNYALVCGVLNESIAVIDLQSFTLKSVHVLDHLCNTIDVASDNHTVVGCTYGQNHLLYGIFDPVTGFVEAKYLPTIQEPHNVTISPDGKTVLVCGTSSLIGVFEITAPGEISPGIHPTLPGFVDETQSCTFTHDGTMAYTVSTTYNSSKDYLSWLQINAPGDVTIGGIGVASLLGNANNPLSGVDIIDLTRNDTYALVGNAADATYSTGLSHDVAFVNLNNFTVTALPTNSSYPCGIATFRPFTGAVPSLGRGYSGFFLLLVAFSGALICFSRKAAKIAKKTVQ